MKRIVLVAVCAIAATAAAAEWHYLSGGKLSGISSVGSHVWAVGQDGLFFYSEDNGQYWRRVPRFTTRNLVDVEFWDQGFGLVTAEGDMLYRTTDNGAKWDSISIQLIGGHIRFITRDCVWVTISDGAIRRSTDGGLTWPLLMPSWISPWFFDSLEGWSSYQGHVFHTSDAGVRGQPSWQEVGRVPSGSVNCFGFSDSLHGICAWYYYTPPPYEYAASGWLSTSNGGVSWEDLGNGTPGVVCDVGQDGRVYGLEANGVVIWGPPVNSRFGVSRFQVFRDISAARGDRAWVCGDGGAIWSSLDSGVSWIPMKPQSGTSLGNVDFTDSLHGWGVSSHWAARTTDGGRSWIPAATGGLPWISDVVALGESTCVTAAGWTVGDMVHGYSGEFGLERTVNAGASWDTINFIEIGDYDVPIGSSRFSHIGRRIWHAGTRTPNGNSLRSTDDGMTWLDMDTVCTIGEGEPADISFVDSLNGWVIDSRGNIRRTTNSGDSWTIIATGLDVGRLKMTSLTTGWAISGSELFKTTDGGVTWNGGVVHSGLHAIAFCDSMHGAVVGNKGLILRTSDGGQTWVWDENEFTSDLYDVCMLDSTRAWAVGQYGLVLGFGDWAIGVDEARGNEGPLTLAVAVAVRPNPSRGRATVEFSRPLSKPTRMTLVDVAGRVHLDVTARTGAQSFDLDLRGTPSGIYFLHAGAGPAARLVVQR